MELKAKKPFVWSLIAILSLTLIGVAVDIMFTTKYAILLYLTSIVPMILGLGFFTEGWRRLNLKDGISGTEFTHIVTLTVGVFSTIAGILRLPFLSVSIGWLDTALVAILLASVILVPIEVLLVK